MSLPSSPFIVRADRVRAGCDATAILAAAEAQAERMRRELAAERRATLEEATQEGLRRGLAEAAMVAAGATDAVAQFWREREHELAEVAIAAAQRILSSLPVDDTVSRLALEAIAEHVGDATLGLRVRPETAAALRAALAAHGVAGRVSVVADPAADAGECTLVHPRGRTEIGLLAQFRAMMHALPRALFADPEIVR